MEAVTYLRSLRRFGIRPGLERTVELSLLGRHQAQNAVVALDCAHNEASVAVLTGNLERVFPVALGRWQRVRNRNLS